MQQDSDEQAPSGVVEDPRKDDGHGYDQQDEHREVREEGSEAGNRPSMLPRRQEMWQVPAGPQDTQDDSSLQRTIARLHAGQQSRTSRVPRPAARPERRIASPSVTSGLQ